MRSWGFTLLIVGVGSFILPAFGIQFILVDIFGPLGPVVAVIAAIVGVGLIWAGSKRQEEEEVT
jgi:hypothetical protein